MREIAEIVLIALASLQTFKALDVNLKPNILATLTVIILTTVLHKNGSRFTLFLSRTMNKPRVKLFIADHFPNTLGYLNMFGFMLLCNIFNPLSNPIIGKNYLICMEDLLDMLQLSKISNLKFLSSKDHKNSQDYKNYKKEKQEIENEMIMSVLSIDKGARLKNGRIHYKYRKELSEKIKSKGIREIKGFRISSILNIPQTCLKCFKSRCAEYPDFTRMPDDLKFKFHENDYLKVVDDYNSIKGMNNSLGDQVAYFNSELESLIKQTDNDYDRGCMYVYPNGLSYSTHSFFSKGNFVMIVRGTEQRTGGVIKFIYNYRIINKTSCKTVLSGVSEGSNNPRHCSDNLSLFWDNIDQSITTHLTGKISHALNERELFGNIFKKDIFICLPTENLVEGFRPAGLEIGTFPFLKSFFKTKNKEDLSKIIKLVNSYGIFKSEDIIEVLIRKVIVFRTPLLSNKQGKLFYSDLNHLFNFLGMEFKYKPVSRYNETERLINVKESAISPQEVQKILQLMEPIIVEPYKQEVSGSEGVKKLEKEVENLEQSINETLEVLLPIREENGNSAKKVFEAEKQIEKLSNIFIPDDLKTWNERVERVDVATASKSEIRNLKKTTARRDEAQKAYERIRSSGLEINDDEKVSDLKAKIQEAKLKSLIEATEAHEKAVVLEAEIQSKFLKMRRTKELVKNELKSGTKVKVKSSVKKDFNLSSKVIKTFTRVSQKCELIKDLSENNYRFVSVNKKIGGGKANLKEKYRLERKGKRIIYKFLSGIFVTPKDKGGKNQSNQGNKLSGGMHEFKQNYPQEINHPERISEKVKKYLGMN